MEMDLFVNYDCDADQTEVYQRYLGVCGLFSSAKMHFQEHRIVNQDSCITSPSRSAQCFSPSTSHNVEPSN